MTLLLYFFGFISGITTALFGFGGGFITVPLLYALITLVWGPRSDAGDVAMKIAVATSTYVMIISASVSSRAHYIKGNLNWNIIRSFIIPKQIELGEGFIGMIYIKGALILIASSWLGIGFAGLLMPYLSDNRHAQIYPLLLLIVLCVMLLT